MESTHQLEKDEITAIQFSDFPALINTRASEKKSYVYCIIDSACDKNIYPMLKNSKWDYTCLYKKNIHFEGDRMCEELAATAPYFLVLDPAKIKVEHFIQERIGKNQIIVFESEAPEQVILDHCSSMLKAMDEDGKVISFRYYDPRILRAYLPTCTDEEKFIFFGDIETIWVEGEDEEILEFVKDKKKDVVEQKIEEPAVEPKVDDTTSGITEQKKETLPKSGEGFGIMGDFFKKGK